MTRFSKRQFVIDTGKEEVPIEGYEHKSVATKYLMKRRRSLLVTKNKEKVDRLFDELPREVTVKGQQLDKTFKVNWERVGTTEFEGARFVFTLEAV
ncbi:MAG: hypothetical protein V3W09_04880 [Nitrososphaerales archaeon]